MTLHVVVMEDDAGSRQRLVGFLQVGREVVVVGQPKDGPEALAIIDNAAPEALFLDCSLPRKWGFDPFQRMRVDPLLVATTTHRTAVSPILVAESVEVLEKPFRIEDVVSVVKKLVELTACSFQSRLEANASLHHRADCARDCTQILLPVKDELKPIRFDQIIYLESQDKSTFVRTVNGTYEAPTPLRELEQRLPPGEFIRIHRRHIVNRGFISTLRRWGNRQFKIELTVPDAGDLVVSRRSHDEVLRRLGGTV